MSKQLKIGSVYRIFPKKEFKMENMPTSISLPVPGFLFPTSKIIYIKKEMLLTYLGKFGTSATYENREPINFEADMFLIENQRVTILDLNRPVNEQEYIYEEII